MRMFPGRMASFVRDHGDGNASTLRGLSVHKRYARVGLLFLLTAVATSPSVQAADNGVIAYSDILERGNGYEKRAIFTSPNRVQLTHPEGPVGKDSDISPAWSRDGKKLAWIRLVRLSDTASEWTIMVADADGA